jgi:hypothetical protein
MISKQSFRAFLPQFMVIAFVLTLAMSFGGTANFAQSTGGRIRGTVTDSSGGAISTAKIVITNQANGAQRETETGRGTANTSS